MGTCVFGCLVEVKRDRTADLLHAMQALSQLSYTPNTTTTSLTTLAKVASPGFEPGYRRERAVS